MTLGRCSSTMGWFAEGLRRKLGRGDKTELWEDLWMGYKSFKELFPRLYYISEQRSINIVGVGNWSMVCGSGILSGEENCSYGRKSF